MTRSGPPEIWGWNGGIYVGFDCPARTKGRPNLEGMPVQAVTDRHLVLLGPNGSGKTRGFVYPNVLKLVDWSLVILDFKGEILQTTAQYRLDKGSNIRVLNPFRVRGFHTDGFNPLASVALDELNYVDDCDAIANILSPVESDENRHFDEGAQDMISVPMLERLHNENAPQSLRDVRNMLNLSDDQLQKRMQAISKKAEQDGFYSLAGRSNRFRSIKATDRELKSVISTARTKLRWLDSKAISDDLDNEPEPFDWQRLKTEPTVVYIILPANRIYQHRSWLKLVLHCILARLLHDQTPSAVPIMFMLDEAAQIAGIPIIEQNMAMLRGANIKIASLYQDYPQAKLALGERVGSYLANAGCLIGYAPQDLDTAEMLSRRGGITQFYPVSLNMERDEESGKLSAGYSHSPDHRDAVMPQHLMGMPAGYAVYYSHLHEGARTVYFPDPSEVPELAAAMRAPRPPGR